MPHGILLYGNRTILFPGGDIIYSTLVVSSSLKFASAIEELLTPDTFAPVDPASSPETARAVARERSYELFFINASRDDDRALSLAVDAADTGAVVLLLLPADDYDAVRARVRSHGVLTLKKPVSMPMLAQAADFMCSIAERQRRLRKTTASADERIEDMKLINRAKWLLIDNLKMTEQDAHRYIERQAMDRCISKRDVAESIIKTYKSV